MMIDKLNIEKTQWAGRKRQNLHVTLEAWFRFLDDHTVFSFDTTAARLHFSYIDHRWWNYFNPLKPSQKMAGFPLLLARPFGFDVITITDPMFAFHIFCGLSPFTHPLDHKHPQTCSLSKDLPLHYTRTHTFSQDTGKKRSTYLRRHITQVNPHTQTLHRHLNAFWLDKQLDLFPNKYDGCFFRLQVFQGVGQEINM